MKAYSLDLQDGGLFKAKFESILNRSLVSNKDLG